jgi:hypothetical protein
MVSSGSAKLSAFELSARGVTVQRRFWAPLSALLFAFSANADILRFPDATGYEKCLRTDPLAERKDTASGAQTRWLNAADVQIRCVERAAKFLAGKHHEALNSTAHLNNGRNGVTAPSRQPAIDL